MGLGLGIGVWWPYKTSIIPGLLKALCARATYCENKTCTTAILEEIAAVRYTPPPPPPPPGLLLEDYPGASAAYSLRNLIDTTTSVVRVRRSSDNLERDITATEITDGTLVDFTNQGWFQSLTNTFTTFTGNGVSGFDATDDAGFGEAFVNVENGVSGDVVNITLDTSSLTGTWTIVLVDASGTVARSNSVLLTSGSNSVALTATGDFAFVDIFCQNPTTSISITNFSASINVGDDGFVTTWYDQSGNSDNATQATAISQAKIIDNGFLTYINGTTPSLYFEQSERRHYAFTGASYPISFFAVKKGINNTQTYQYTIGTSLTRGLRAVNENYADNSPFAVSNLYVNNQLGETNSLQYHSINYCNANGDTILDRIGTSRTSSAYSTGMYITEFIVYPSDQSANRIGIETNINTEYTIY